MTDCLPDSLTEWRHRYILPIMYLKAKTLQIFALVKDNLSF